MNRLGSFLKPEHIDWRQELVGARTMGSKTFRLGGRRFFASTVMGAVHYREDMRDDKEHWKDIDLTFNQQPDGSYFIDKAPYYLKFLPDKIGYIYQSRMGGTVTVELESVGGKSPVVAEPQIKERQVIWPGVSRDVDIALTMNGLGVEVYKRLNSLGAARSFRWKIMEDEHSNAQVRTKTAGYDNKFGGLEMKNRIVDKKVANGKRSFILEEEWTGRVSEVADRVRRIRRWTGRPEYPVLIDASTSEVVTANADDGQEGQSYSIWDSRSTGLWTAGNFTFGIYNGGVRFQTLGIVKNSTINSATYTVNVNYRTGTPQTTIYGDDVDDAPVFTASDRPSQVTKTTASATFNPSGTGDQTADVTDIVQELVNRSGWVSGNDIRLAILNSAGSTGNAFGAFDYFYGNTNLSSRLSVDYTEAGGSGPSTLKTADTVAAANVKTRDGVAIANIKTWDTAT